jgi:prepilin signal peptidase PulO-like enzyme (type II secretory pathway)
MIFDRLLEPDMPAPLVLVMLGWLFAVGACIGSFMNVVIYRLPAGLSLLHPPSRCPKCETPIRATDNVPIFGWLWLSGRCRHCEAAISARYPAVELLVALLFFGLAWIEVFTAGSNLPVEEHRLTMAEAWGIYGFHLFLVCSLICAAFIEFDGHPMPLRLALPPLIVGIAAPLILAHLRPFGSGALEGILGVAGGAIIGLAMWPFGRSRRVPWRDFSIALAWIGAFLGLQTASALAVVATASRLLVALVGHLVPVVRPVGVVGCLALCTMIWIVVWKPMVDRLPWLGADATPKTFVMAVVGVALLALMTARIAPEDDSSRLTGNQRRPRR